MFGLNPAADSIESVLEDSVVSSSRGLGWDGFEVMSARIPGDGFEVDGLRSHTLAINVGRPFALEARIDGRTGDGAMPTGAMKIVAAGPRSVWRWRSEAPLDMLHVSIDDTALRAFAAELGLAPPELGTRVGFADPMLRQSAVALAAELGAPATRSLVTDGLRVDLIVRLLDAYSSLPAGAAGRLPRTRLGARTLRLLEAYVQAHLETEIRIGDLAALAGLSRFHFARMFRASVGQTPHRYVLDRRLARARDLVRSGDSPLREIAALTGFADQSHLTRTFKRTFGTTPAAMRAG
jgi:AraC family transcriptional regulator